MSHQVKVCVFINAEYSGAANIYLTGLGKFPFPQQNYNSVFIVVLIIVCVLYC